jgi:hypothetical protein
LIMKSIKTVLTAGLLLAVFQSAYALEKLVAVESAAEHNSLTWISQYYKNPQPEMLVRRAYILSDMGYFEQEGQPAQAVGFFATIFAQHPERVDGWIAAFRGLPVKHQRLLAAAAWLSGQPRGASRLQELSSGADSELLASLLKGAPGPVADTAVLSESSMYLQWGAFVASGKETHVINILTAIGEETPGLAQSATVSLAMNAAQDERVLEICQTQLDKQPKVVQDILRAALNDAQTKVTPAS